MSHTFTIRGLVTVCALKLINDTRSNIFGNVVFELKAKIQQLRTFFIFKAWRLTNHVVNVAEKDKIRIFQIGCEFCYLDMVYTKSNFHYTGCENLHNDINRYIKTENYLKDLWYKNV